MRNDIFKDVTNYIDFLRLQGYNCVLSNFDMRFEPYTQELYLYEIHLSSVCSYLKQNKLTEGQCGKQKRKLNSMDFDYPFYSCCYAGVEEYVLPVNFEGETIMRIHISGYRDTLEKSSYCKDKIKGICGSGFIKVYNELSQNPPSLSEVLRFTKPLEYMIIELYKHCSENKKVLTETKKIYLKAVGIIQEKYSEGITVTKLSSIMNYSPTYLRYIFKKEGNTTPNKYIKEARLENAKYLILNTSLNMTEIAYRSGFSDSNYFSTAFKQRYGQSPKVYKKSIT